MSLLIFVDAYSGYRANERPRQFCLDDEVHEIVEIESRWREPDSEYFNVRTTDGKRYVLRYDEHSDQWTLGSDFDGADLFARSSIELTTVDAKTIRDAESRIAGCEQCRGDEAHYSFDWIVAVFSTNHWSSRYPKRRIVRVVER